MLLPAASPAPVSPVSTRYTRYAVEPLRLFLTPRHGHIVAVRGAWLTFNAVG